MTAPAPQRLAAPEPIMFDRPIDDYKTCKNCLELKPRSAFYARSGRARQYDDGLMSWCKACHNRRTNAWPKEHPVQARKMRQRATARYQIRKRGYMRVSLAVSDLDLLTQIAKRLDCSPTDCASALLSGLLQSGLTDRMSLPDDHAADDE